MRGTITDTLEELGAKAETSLEVEIDYDNTPGERRVMYPNDKAYPGSDPMVELDKVTVTEWWVGDEERPIDSRNQPPLDEIAEDYVERLWNSIYSDLCLEDAADNYYERKNPC
jgi:hypothetical protein